MAQFGSVKDEIQQAGAALVFIAAEKRDGMFKPEKFLAKHPTPFPFLLDEERKVTKAYGVYHRLGRDAVHIARPATFVVDDERMVRFIYVGLNQTDRIAVAALLEILQKL
jgi:peroxiredoxin